MHINDFRDVLDKAVPIGGFTLDNIARAFETAFGAGESMTPREKRIMLITRHDVNQLLMDGRFADYLDPVTKLEVIQHGKIADFMGMDVYSDATLQDPKQAFIKESALYAVP